MSLIRAFRAVRPVAERATEVAAPPYDAVTEREARALAARSRWSFLHVSRPEVNFPPGSLPSPALMYARAAQRYAAMLDEGILLRDERPRYYVYRMEEGQHRQVGLAAAVAVRAYDTLGRVLRHELTQPEKETERARHMEVLNAQAGPVYLMYRARGGIDSLLAELCAAPAELEAVTGDGVTHSVWTVRDAARTERITAEFERVRRLYIADGHHRVAAASRVAASRRHGAHAGARDDWNEYFLAVMFPHDQVRVLDFNRAVRGLNGLSVVSFLDRVRGAGFEVARDPAPERPRARGEFGMYLAGYWYRLRLRDAEPAGAGAHDPVARLGVTVLGDRLLRPVLGVQDPRRDPRLALVGGGLGPEAVRRAADARGVGVGFTLPATPVEDLLDVADSSRVMPPKSTWFSPKLADGLLSYPLD